MAATPMPAHNLISNTETALVAQSSQFFPNAAGFQIVGGQFVSGDVHNHPIVDSRGQTSLPSMAAMPDAYAESEVYCSQLMRQRRGFPLYVPEPQRNLPEQYQRNGVSIGDVGRVTPEGIFDFFFNIYLPPGHPINANVPEDFSPMPPYASVDIFHLDFVPGNHVSTPSVQKLDLNLATENFPGGDFMFNCEAPHGAVLALPHGGHLEKLENLENIRQYAAKHAESWYRYINGTRGRGLANGSLYLVTGTEKSRSWGMASFHDVREEFQLAFKPTSGTHNYHWRGIYARKNPARNKSSATLPIDRGPLNQTNFVHGLSISLGTGIWGRLFGEVKICDMVDSQLGNTNSDSVPYSQGSSVFSWSLSFFGSDSTTGGTHRANREEDVVISDFPAIPRISHPAKIINNYLLQKAPHAAVVMSHDDDWRDILQDFPAFVMTALQRQDGARSIVRNPSELLQQINDRFNVMENDGMIFLVSKSKSSPSESDLLSEVSTNSTSAQSPASSTHMALFETFLRLPEQPSTRPNPMASPSTPATMRPRRNAFSDRLMCRRSPIQRAEYEMAVSDTED
ncbi:hypothetical protein B0H13DRAFT_1906754 [Mycena leptocephala]|nr:hypothetical protein B0H13DRAFT_1906754 [Mycena leptocephala]